MLNPESISSYLTYYIKGLLNNILFKLPHKLGEGFPLYHIPRGPGFGGGDSSPNGNVNSGPHNHSTSTSTTYDPSNFRPPVSTEPIRSEIVRREVEEGHRVRTEFLSLNPNQNTVHTDDTIRHRAEALHSRSILSARSYGEVGSNTHNYHLNMCNSYN